MKAVFSRCRLWACFTEAYLSSECFESLSKHGCSLSSKAQHDFFLVLMCVFVWVCECASALQQNEMLVQQTFLGYVAKRLSCVFSLMTPIFNVFSFFLIYIFIYLFQKGIRPFYLCLSPSDPTVLRTSGSTYSIRANMRVWRCTTVPNVATPPILPWSSATTWRNTTLILRIQTSPTYMQVNRSSIYAWGGSVFFW